MERTNSCGLMDLGVVGTRFTRREALYHDGYCIFKRLDRAMCNDNWRLRIPEALVCVLPRVECSDHHPILICPYGINHVGLQRKFLVFTH